MKLHDMKVNVIVIVIVILCVVICVIKVDLTP